MTKELFTEQIEKCFTILQQQNVIIKSIQDLIDTDTLTDEQIKQLESNIVTNSANIAKNRNDILGLTSENITNKANIQKNTNDIASNTNLIDKIETCFFVNTETQEYNWGDINIPYTGELLEDTKATGKLLVDTLYTNKTYMNYIISDYNNTFVIKDIKDNIYTQIEPEFNKTNELIGINFYLGSDNIMIEYPNIQEYEDYNFNIEVPVDVLFTSRVICSFELVTYDLVLFKGLVNFEERGFTSNDIMTFNEMFYHNLTIKTASKTYYLTYPAYNINLVVDSLQDLTTLTHAKNGTKLMLGETFIEYTSNVWKDANGNLVTGVSDEVETRY